MGKAKKKDNQRRIEQARAAIYYMLDDTETNIIDMMTNLMHLAASEGISVKSVTGVAMMHWEAER
jgi:hypothetical protein